MRFVVSPYRNDQAEVRMQIENILRLRMGLRGNYYCREVLLEQLNLKCIGRDQDSTRATGSYTPTLFVPV